MKITIKEFFESKESLAIHTPTKEQATKLLKAVYKQGYSWDNGESYLDANYWLVFKENTIYGNDGYYGSIKINSQDAKILNFKDIDFEDVKSMDKDCMVEVLKILGCNLGEEFSVVEENGVEIEESPFMFVKLLNGKTTFIGCSCASQGDVLIEILNGTYKIIKNGISDV